MHYSQGVWNFLYTANENEDLYRVVQMSVLHANAVDFMMKI